MASCTWRWSTWTARRPPASSAPRRAAGKTVPLEAALYIALSVLRGLDYAHNARDDDGRRLALVHRDVSPGNVLIDRSGAVKLTDFGIARAAEIERRTDAGQLKGKLGYMSPEQVVGKELDARSDLFTAAIVLAELVMLRPLFSGRARSTCSCGSATPISRSSIAPARAYPTT